MDLFRARCRRFLKIHATGNPEPGRRDPRGDLAMDRARAFQRALFEAGLAGLTVPVDLGGQGLGPEYERVWREEAAKFPLMTEPLAVGLGNCLPLLVEHGTPEQRMRHVRAMLSGEEVCCQLFSEPGAGSDLASVSARAQCDGDGWRLNGQKVWTTFAHRAAIGILLARTGSTAGRHDGMSMFVLDMRATGVEIRPIHQIDDALLFDEVFLTDVHLGPAALIPPEGGGWALAVAMMHHQRLARGTSATGGMAHNRATEISALTASHPCLGSQRRAAIADLATAEMVRSLTAVRARDELTAGKPVGPSGSLSKLAYAMVAPRAADLAASVVGPGAIAWEDNGSDSDEVARAVVHSRQYSIAGGTSEIQRNIIGERVLGLPKEPR
jgi:alkylation response protein AidB-like acyl-CoA dehydrogenase